MDIKLKNIRYSTRLKTVAVLMVWICFGGIYVSALFGMQFGNEIGKNNYYETADFLNEFNRYVYSSIDYAVTLRSEEYIKSGNTLPTEASGEENSGTGTSVDRELQKEGMGVTKKVLPEIIIRSTIKGTEQGEREKIITAHLQRFQQTKAELDRSVNFEYLVINRKTGTAITNIKDYEGEKTVNGLSARKVYLQLSEQSNAYSIQDYSYRFSGDLKERFRNTPYELHAAIKEPLTEGDRFYKIAERYNTVHKLLPAMIVIGAASVVVGLICFVYLILVAGRREKKGEVHRFFLDWIYNDVHALLLLIPAFVSVSAVPDPSHILLNGDMFESIVLFMALSVNLLIGLSFIFSMVRHIKNKSLLKHTLMYVVFTGARRFLQRCFTARFFRITVLLFLLGYGGLNGLLFTVLILGDDGFQALAMVLLVALTIAALYWVAKSMVSLSNIMLWVKTLSKGNLEDEPDIGSTSAALADFALDIRNLQAGLKKAVWEAVKGERLKTELITNVSHDLKTPLTSIINYVDLLKKEEPENETVKNYIGILDEKAGRMKQLIEDLLEASKAASGNLVVSFESVDLHALVLQAMAEFSEKAEEARLDLRIKAAEPAPLVQGDGKLLWRILENLLSNVVKYAQRDSRVYIDIENTEKEGMITIKNISAHELDIPAEQLLERFVRGDEARTTEGAGLGLSIAKSLAEIQGGKLEIFIDGDLFKVRVIMPLS